LVNTLNKKLQRTTNIIIKDCLGIKKNEKVVVVTDKICRTIGYSLWHALRKITDPIIIEITPRQIHGEEPPQLVADILKKCDVFIMPTSCSLSHTQARIEANRHGARGTTMPGITTEIMGRTLNADYKKIADTTLKLVNQLSKAKKAFIKTDKKTTLELNLKGRKGFIDTGIIQKPGEFSNLPAGEAYIAPVENKTNGNIIIDGSFAPIGILKKKVTLEIKNGNLIELKGSKRLNQIFKKYGKNERIVCEFGIGTNPKAKITGKVLEDEKVLGSIHIAFGNNLAFGGKNQAKIHLDAVVKKPSVWLDKTPIIKKGKFIF
jgi:aminopeptidase